MAATMAGLGPAAAKTWYVNILAAQSKVVRRQARRRNFVFTDRRPAGGPRLRKTIRIRRVPSVYYGRRYRYGRISLYAGNRDSAQAFLVHEGHGGPRPARPYPYIAEAVSQTVAEQSSAIEAEATRRFPMIVEQARRERTAGGNRTIAVARAIARRSRRR